MDKSMKFNWLTANNLQRSLYISLPLYTTRASYNFHAQWSISLHFRGYHLIVVES